MTQDVEKEFRKVYHQLRCKANCGSTGSYKSYTVALTQDNTDAPQVANTFENTLNVNAVYSYDAAGNYLVTFDKPLFDNPWDYVVLTGGFGDIAVGAIPVWWNAISIQTADTGVASDNILGHYYPNILEIRKYK